MDCLVVKSSMVYEGVEVEAASVREVRFLIVEYEFELSRVQGMQNAKVGEGKEEAKVLIAAARRRAEQE